jgi:hypothetical protein
MSDISILDAKVQQLKDAFHSIDPNQDLVVDDNGNGGKLVYGPFPSFIVLVEEVGPLRALVHVNADAPNMVLCFQKFFKELDIEFDGPFAVDSDTGELIQGQEAYAKKEENILMFAADIIQRRKASEQQGIVVPDKKIILA